MPTTAAPCRSRSSIAAVFSTASVDSQFGPLLCVVDGCPRQSASRLSVLDARIPGMSLPQPRVDTSLVLRTDFTDDQAWEALKAAISAENEHDEASFVSDPAYDGATVRALIETDVAAADDEKVCHVFVADAVAMTGGEHALLVVDLFSPPYEAVRVAPSGFAEVSANLESARSITPLAF